jgi:hypothetical protein
MARGGPAKRQWLPGRYPIIPVSGGKSRHFSPGFFCSNSQVPMAQCVKTHEKPAPPLRSRTSRFALRLGLHENRANAFTPLSSGRGSPGPECPTAWPLLTPAAAEETSRRRPRAREQGTPPRLSRPRLHHRLCGVVPPSAPLWPSSPAIEPASVRCRSASVSFPFGWPHRLRSGRCHQGLTPASCHAP